MALVLVRIDDRLIHGQVILGWAHALHPDRIVLVNDNIAKSSWHREVYEAAVPSEIGVSILGLDRAVKYLTEREFDEERILVIVESPRNALSLVRKGIDIKSVNVGGLHHTEGKDRLLPYVYVTNQDIDAFKELIAMGVEVECRDVPTAKKIDMRKLL
ncbi:MAG: PTS sugar transporter subunit IIB [Gemmatimonadota bacterium]|nr:MAG: PTS sugar transporter subunit IIB [Gemmatimonadota bacterium]